MRKAKRWLALILAVTLVSSNALYQIGTTLKADEIETQSEEVLEEASTDESEELPKMPDSGEATVEEVEDPAAGNIAENTDEEKESETVDESKDANTSDEEEIAENDEKSEQADVSENTETPGTTDTFAAFAMDGDRAVNEYYEVFVGNEISVTGAGNNWQYSHEWTSADSTVAAVEGNGQTATIYGIAPGTTTITHKYAKGWFSGTDTFKVIVAQAVDATDVTIEGINTLKALESTQLVAKITPEDGQYKTLSWRSSDEDVLTVDENGKVTAVAEGTATVSAYMVKNDGSIASASLEITVTAAATDTQDVTEAAFYYLKTPTSTLDSNVQSDWGSVLGKGKVNLVNASWIKSQGKKASNTYSNVENRVISWPSEGTANGNKFVLNKGAHWTAIFNAYKSSVEASLGRSIDEDDVESIALIPYKISKDNEDVDKVHVDCRVEITCKKVVTAQFYLWDAGKTGYDRIQATDYNKDDKILTAPFTEAKKTVNGIEYEFDGWYTDQSLMTPAQFPYTISQNTDFYAKYIPTNLKYKVEYYWNGTDQLIASKNGSGKRPGDTVVETPATLSGYTPVTRTAQTITISETGENVIKFYYYKNVTLTGNSATYTYDGSAHTAEGYTGAPEDAQFDNIQVSRTETAPGTYAVEFPTGTEGTLDGSGKYMITKTVPGELTINKADIQTLTLTTKNVEKVYDGTPLAAGEAEVSGTDEPLTIEYKKASDDDSQWTTDRNKVTELDATSEEGVAVDVRVSGANYDGTLTNTEYIKITKRTLTVTTASADKKYDNKPLKATEGWKVENLASGETLGIRVTGQQTYIGSSPNTCELIWSESDNTYTAKRSNYIVQEQLGTLTVNDGDPTDPVVVVEKTHDSKADGSKFKLGETITFRIKVQNTFADAKVITLEEMPGVVFENGGSTYKTTTAVQPGQFVEVTAAYTVTSEDIVNASIVNTVTASFEGVDKKYSGSDTVTELEEVDPKLLITKELIDRKETYAIGETVKYRITVENIGNMMQNRVVVTDKLKAAGTIRITEVNGVAGTVSDNEVTFDVLNPGEKATILAEYTVHKEDSGTTILNAATVKGIADDPEETPDVPANAEKTYNIQVVHEFASGNESETVLPEDYTIKYQKANTSMLIQAESVEGYVAQPEGQLVQVVDQDVTLTLLYYKDQIGTDPVDPEKPDGIPDDYQVIVRYEAENGTVTLDHAVVTLFDEDGNPSKDGVGHLSPFQIASANANEGYDQSSMKWTPDTPTTEYDITKAMTFTAAFSAPTVTPEENVPGGNNNPPEENEPSGNNDQPSENNPVENNPVENGLPVDTTPQPTQSIISRVITPVIDSVRERIADIQEILQSDDEEVPLADQKLDDHKCCVLHFLILLLALVFGIFATSSMKKRQKKLQEIREELDCELARRGLPVTSEKE